MPRQLETLSGVGRRENGRVTGLLQIIAFEHELNERAEEF